MIDEGLIIEVEGRVVGVVVGVRGGLMFFSSDPDLRELEATVFQDAESVTQRVAEIVDALGSWKGESPKVTSPNWTTSEVHRRRDNVVQLRPPRWSSNLDDPQPPDAA